MRLTMAQFAQRFPGHALSRQWDSANKSASQAKEGKTDKRAGKRGGQRRALSGAKASALEVLFAQQLQLAGLPAPEREFKFHSERKWRMDFAWPDISLAVEVEGGIWNYGRHNRPQGFIADTEKYNAASVMGWTLLRFTGAQIRTGCALKQVQDAFFNLHQKSQSNPRQSQS